jgi:hypothetical protein
MISVPCPFFGAFAASCMSSDVEAKSQYIYTYIWIYITDILRIYMQYHAIILYIYYIVGHGFLKNHVLCLKKWTIKKEDLRLPK